ncbi:carbohydrate esterase family 5 protein [Polyplosphaeria fusca]|uniref:Cutinase n=1 Tax=Polyplosphaeria fusca TaxID=682080 RepID=A0A9P4QJR2_9PLEO|nr:carbohydrate esterase family 5 protein [Polyplosphaeria fusca]
MKTFALTSTLLPLALALPSQRLALTTLSGRALDDINQNDVNNGLCKPVTVLFARGTTERGNMGTLTGPPFVEAVGAAVGEDNIAVQGIDYPADIPGFLAGGDADGSALMAQLVGEVMAACPTTKLVMSGYSQGGQLVHNAADMLSAAETEFVSSAVIFGDPNNGQAVGALPAAKTKVFCNDGDNICEGGNLILRPHLTYSDDAGDAAAFVQANAN